MNNISKVVYDNKCIGCGICAGTCPNSAIEMIVNRNGDLSATVNEDLCIQKCSLCLDICNFSSGYFNPREMNSLLYSKNNKNFKEEVGWYQNSFIGFNKNPIERKNSASGGLLSFILKKLLKDNIVDRVTIIKYSNSNSDNLFEAVSIKDYNDVESGAGSIYHPVEFSKIIKEIKNNDYKWAVVGVPCLCANIRNVKQISSKIKFVFGLACGMYQNSFYTKLLLNLSNKNFDNITNIKYRLNVESECSNNFSFACFSNKKEGKRIQYLGLPLFLGSNGFFRQNACNYCMDVFAETADACFMDAWLPEFINNGKGTSLVLSRNNEVYNLFDKYKSEIMMRSVSIDDVMLSQKTHIIRKKKLIDFRLGNTSDYKISFSDKINIILQKYVQCRSKMSWRIFGNRYGNFIFWIFSMDYILLIVIKKYFFKIYNKLVKL